MQRDEGLEGGRKEALQDGLVVAGGEVEDLLVHGDDDVDVLGLDGGRDGGDVACWIDVRGWDVDGLVDGAGEAADVVVHGVDDGDGVVGQVQLPREVDGGGEAAVGEEDVERGGGGDPHFGFGFVSVAHAHFVCVWYAVW